MAQTSPDIRVSVSFLRNLKTRRLMRELGSGAVLCLLNLWFYAAENHPDGVLPMSIDDAVDVADPSRFGVDAAGMRAALQAAEWVETDAHGNVLLHQWNEHQEWLSGFEERSKVARENAKRGWEKRRKTPRKRAAAKHAGGMPSAVPSASAPHASGKPSAMLLSSPLPSITPLAPRAGGNTSLRSLPDPARRYIRGGRPPEGYLTWDSFMASEAMTRSRSAEQAAEAWLREQGGQPAIDAAVVAGRLVVNAHADGAA